MKNLLAIVALTILTSTASANNAEGDSYTGSGPELNIEHTHPTQRDNNNLDDTRLSSQGAVHKHSTPDLSGSNEDSGA